MSRHHSSLLLLLPLLLRAPAQAETPPACQPQSETRQAAVAEVLDNTDLRLANGETIRLIGALPVYIYPKAASPAARALNEQANEALHWLRQRLKGQTVRYRPFGRRRDRYDRLLAHVWRFDGEWIQGELLRRGFARAYSFADNRACWRAMLRAENEARQARRGLWRFRTLQPVNADKTGLLLRRLYRYQLVEGRIHKVAALRRWTFVNFAADWKRDFTIAVKAKYRRLLKKQGLDLSALEGRRVRVRGWIERWNGPAIKVTHPEQIEVLDEAGAAVTPK